MPEGTCSADDCDRLGKLKRGLCTAHYARWRKTGVVGGPIRRWESGRTCSINGCSRPYWATDLCSTHYVRKFKSGDPKAEDPILPRGTDDVGYDGVHKRVRSLRGPASDYSCTQCSAPATTWAYDHEDPNPQIVEDYKGTPNVPYSLKPEHYMPLCGSCHKRYDLLTLRLGLRSRCHGRKRN